MQNTTKRNTSKKRSTPCRILSFIQNRKGSSRWKRVAYYHHSLPATLSHLFPIAFYIYKGHCSFCVSDVRSETFSELKTSVIGAPSIVWTMHNVWYELDLFRQYIESYTIYVCNVTNHGTSKPSVIFCPSQCEPWEPISNKIYTPQLSTNNVNCAITFMCCCEQNLVFSKVQYAMSNNPPNAHKKLTTSYFSSV